MSGWYFGIWGDYDSCLKYGYDTQYILAKANGGNFTGDYEFTRGSVGKYTGGFSTNIGLCLPKECTADDVRNMTEELMLGHLHLIGWPNASMTYIQSSAPIQPVLDSKRNLLILGILLITAYGLMGLGLLFEVTPIGDKSELRDTQDKVKALNLAARFRNATQYDCVLL